MTAFTLARDVAALTVALGIIGAGKVLRRLRPVRVERQPQVRAEAPAFDEERVRAQQWIGVAVSGRIEPEVRA